MIPHEKTTSRYHLKLTPSQYSVFAKRDGLKWPTISLINNLLGTKVDGEAYMTVTPRGAILICPEAALERSIAVVEGVLDDGN